MKLKKLIKSCVFDRTDPYKIIELSVENPDDLDNDIVFELIDFRDYLAYRNHKVMEFEETMLEDDQVKLTIWLYSR